MQAPLSDLLTAILPAILALPFSFTLFFVLCSRFKDEDGNIAHLRGFKQLFSYFLFPFQPEKMLVSFNEELKGISYSLSNPKKCWYSLMRN